jgi:hypothetical protein
MNELFGAQIVEVPFAPAVALVQFVQITAVFGPLERGVSAAVREFSVSNSSDEER